MHCLTSFPSKGPPVKFSDSTNAVRLAPPLLGQHTRQVLQHDLDILSEEQLLKLDEKNVIKVYDNASLSN